MKRIPSTICFILILLFAVVPISANESDDVGSVERDEERIGIYRGNCVDDFANGKPLREILNGSQDLVYLSLEPTEGDAYGIYDSRQTLIETRSARAAEIFVKYAVNPELVLDPADFSVTSVYCVQGISLDESVYVIYETDEESFILYKETLRSETMHLVPLAQFRDFAKIGMEEWRKKYPAGAPDGASPITVKDRVFPKNYTFDGTPLTLAKYEEMLKNYVPPVIAEEKSGLNGWATAGIVGGVLLFAGGVCVSWLLLRKKTSISLA